MEVRQAVKPRVVASAPCALSCGLLLPRIVADYEWKA